MSDDKEKSTKPLTVGKHRKIASQAFQSINEPNSKPSSNPTTASRSKHNQIEKTDSQEQITCSPLDMFKHDSILGAQQNALRKVKKKQLNFTTAVNAEDKQVDQRGIEKMQSYGNIEFSSSLINEENEEVEEYEEEGKQDMSSNLLELDEATPSNLNISTINPSDSSKTTPASIVINQAGCCNHDTDEEEAIVSSRPGSAIREKEADDRDDQMAVDNLDNSMPFAAP